MSLISLFLYPTNLNIIVNTILKPQISPAKINIGYAKFDNTGNAYVDYDI
jgi:hypothetical protein